jgi:hypothetical protein
MGMALSDRVNELAQAAAAATRQAKLEFQTTAMAMKRSIDQQVGVTDAVDQCGGEDTA